MCCRRANGKELNYCGEHWGVLGTKYAGLKFAASFGKIKLDSLR